MRCLRAPTSTGDVTKPVVKSYCRSDALALRPSGQRTDGKMIGEVIVIGDLKRRDDAPLDEYLRLAERMYNIVSHLPGFLSVKSFKATDGEELTVFRFASEEALEAWRTHPEHIEAMKRGHAEFYASGRLQICKVVREIGPFEHS